jgi:hypothetical protein
MMANFAPARGGLAGLAMALATASFLLAGTVVTPGYAAETAGAAKPVTAKAATSMHPGSVDQRITQLHEQLKISANEEQNWKAVADVMRANADDMKKLIEETRSQGPKAKRTALQDLQNYQKFAQAHSEGLQKLSSAFATLYNGMPPDQQANADKVFNAFERRRPTAGQHS